MNNINEIIKSLISFYKKYSTKIIIALFIISRIYIWNFGPTNFSEITYSYMPYAHLWASGVKPYLEQWYEYPPVTIPMFYVPHLIDIATLGQPWHLNYAQAYRGLILINDILIFYLVWQTLTKLKIKKNQKELSLIYFILLTAKAHDFIYDSIDWPFALTMFLAAVTPLFLNKYLSKIGSWLGYWLGVGIKLINAPLGAIYLWLERKEFKKSIFSIILTAAIVWALPLFLYRSSLQVMLVYHSQRGLQIDSVGAVVARVIDTFSHTEQTIEIYKNYEFTGPVSNSILKINSLLFPLSILIFLLFSCTAITNIPTPKNNFLRIHFTLGYLLLFMVFSKVLSTPFLLWHIPFFAVYPFKNRKEQLLLLGSSAVVIVTCLSPLPFIDWGVFHLPTWIHTLKSIILIYWLIWWIKSTLNLTKK